MCDFGFRSHLNLFPHLPKDDMSFIFLSGNYVPMMIIRRYSRPTEGDCRNMNCVKPGGSKMMKCVRKNVNFREEGKKRCHEVRRWGRKRHRTLKSIWYSSKRGISLQYLLVMAYVILIPWMARRPRNKSLIENNQNNHRARLPESPFRLIGERRCLIANLIAPTGRGSHRGHSRAITMFPSIVIVICSYFRERQSQSGKNPLWVQGSDRSGARNVSTNEHMFESSRCIVYYYPPICCSTVNVVGGEDQKLRTPMFRFNMNLYLHLLCYISSLASIIRNYGKGWRIEGVRRT